MVVSQKVSGREFVFTIVSADEFRVSPPMDREKAAKIVWRLLTTPRYDKIRSARPKHRGGVKG